MKTLNYILLFLFTFSFIAQAQVAQVETKIPNPRTYSQLTLFGGYDFPSSKPDFSLMKYNGSFIAGAMYNKYWDWVGFQIEGNYSTTRIENKIKGPLAYTVTGNQTSVFSNLVDHQEDFQKIFLGIGPAFKYQSKNDKFVIDIGLLGGAGLDQGGEYILLGEDEVRNVEKMVNYYSGFKNKTVFAAKGNLRFNYFFKSNFGIFLGGYYMTHFNVNESPENKLLYEFDPSFENLGMKVFTVTPTIEDLTTPIGDATSQLVSVEPDRIETDGNALQQSAYERKSWDMSSFGVMAGLSWKFDKTKSETKCPDGYFLCENDNLCYLDNNCGVAKENNVTVLVKDKTSNQVLTNVDVTLVQQTDMSDAANGITGSDGKVEFDNIPNGDYQIESKLGNLSLPSNSIKETEFTDLGQMEKVVYYNDPSYIISGKVSNCNNGQSITNTKVKVVNTLTLQEKVTMTDENGEYAIQVPSAEYLVELDDKNYFTERTVKNLMQMDRSKVANVIVDICAKKLECNTQLKFNNLLFKFNDYHIEKGSTEELDNLAEFMQVNNKVKLEISAYTDSRGSDAYNLRLSQKRADETVKYLVSQGVQKSRLIAKGYGETHLLNGCTNGVECTEEQQAVNRRTEFKIVCDK